jgi:Family of unknown function (DUF6073)
LSPVQVKEHTVPEAGIDTITITLEETYEVEGIGRDTVRLHGTLVANRTVPLFGFGRKQVEWETSAVVARFTSLHAKGESKLFGPVSVTLDPAFPSQAVAIGPHCSAAIGVIVSLPDHDLTLRTAAPMQLQSLVKTIPPIGDERTESVAPVELVEHRTGRRMGSLHSARVLWRELETQIPHGIPQQRG